MPDKGGWKYACHTKACDQSLNFVTYSLKTLFILMQAIQLRSDRSHTNGTEMIRSLILIALACLLFSCIKEDIPAENEGKVLAEAEIGPGGGVY